jgi:DNA adenine methylase
MDARAATSARPIVKWAGGKTQLLPELLARVPEFAGRYHEPFAGGAALFFALAEEHRVCLLSDSNARLINLYLCVKSRVEGVISRLRVLEHEHSAETYYAARQVFNDATGGEDEAALFVYLNKTCFNGLYRVNRSGAFNVPFGDYARPTICDAENLRAASRALAGTVLSASDFRASAERATAGDLVYFDPPYVPLSATSSFTAYAGAFGEAEHRELARVFLDLEMRGVHVMLSNSDTPLARELYADWAIERVAARRSINSRADRRGELGEILVCNWRRASGR